MDMCTCTKDTEMTCIVHPHDYEKVRVLAAENAAFKRENIALKELIHSLNCALDSRANSAELGLKQQDETIDALKEDYNSLDSMFTSMTEMKREQEALANQFRAENAALREKVERLEGFINDLLDPKTNWPLERIQAHLDRIDEWQEGEQDG